MEDRDLREGELHEVRTGTAEAGGRLDRVLARALAERVPSLSRSRLQGLIGAGAVTRNGAAVRYAGLRVKAGESYAVTVPPPEPAEPVPEAMPLAVVYEDRDLIVIDKPRGVAVHPGPGHASGAARLAAGAALRVGAGLVSVACAADAAPAYAAQLTAVMVKPFATAHGLGRLLDDSRLNAWLIGPGVGVGPATRAFARR